MIGIIEERRDEIKSSQASEHYRRDPAGMRRVWTRPFIATLLANPPCITSTTIRRRRGDSVRGIVASLRSLLSRLGLEPRAILFGTQASGAPVIERDEREHPDHRQDDKDLQQDVTHDECLSIFVIRRRATSTPGACICDREKSAATLPHRRTIVNGNRPDRALKPGGIRDDATAAAFGISISLRRRTAPSAGEAAADI